MKARIVLGIVSLIAVAAVSVTSLGGDFAASAQSQSTIPLVGADALIEGNTATGIGPRDPCVRAEVGSEVVVDFIVDAVPADRPMIGYQINVRYDANLLEVVAANNDLMLGATGQYQPFPGLSDVIPDTDGDYLIIIADLASMAPTAEDPDGANMESGQGVLSRVTFRAKAPGRSDVAPGYDGVDVYPAIIDPQNTTVGVDTIAKTVVAIGEDCGQVPPESQVEELPPIEEILGSATPASTGGGSPGSPTPEGQTPIPSADGSSESPTATPDSTGEDEDGSPTPTPAVLPAAGDDDDETGMMALAAVLALLGAALIGGGAFVLFKRAQASPPPAAG
jgi:hypothetical protein